jgi:hypothetical protein
MPPLLNRRVSIFLGICFLLLISIVIYILLLNRPSGENNLPVPSPTPYSVVPGNNTKPTPVPIYGESGFTSEETRTYLEIRRRAENAYQTRLREMPFITRLPYSNAHFKIEITAVSDTIYISTFGPPSFQARYREEAINWIRQNGGIPENLTISYKN